ncbi:unnamed protein product [Lepeophtheirus salmonis]|uniref:(salmon louse) hypothetical protein n=1 Tax=Lepeophtheirus salmonis TaxID=72036 RepID=A0A817FH44_LEPSM|nr:unnamed protein product [Lepeophtheirus salmonis]
MGMPKARKKGEGGEGEHRKTDGGSRVFCVKPQTQWRREDRYSVWAGSSVVKLGSGRVLKPKVGLGRRGGLTAIGERRVGGSVAASSAPKKRPRGKYRPRDRPHHNPLQKVGGGAGGGTANMPARRIKQTSHQSVWSGPRELWAGKKGTTAKGETQGAGGRTNKTRAQREEVKAGDRATRPEPKRNKRGQIQTGGNRQPMIQKQGYGQRGSSRGEGNGNEEKRREPGAGCKEGSEDYTTRIRTKQLPRKERAGGIHKPMEKAPQQPAGRIIHKKKKKRRAVGGVASQDPGKQAEGKRSPKRRGNADGVSKDICQLWFAAWWTCPMYASRHGTRDSLPTLHFNKICRYKKKSLIIGQSGVDASTASRGGDTGSEGSYVKAESRYEVEKRFSSYAKGKG